MTNEHQETEERPRDDSRGVSRVSEEAYMSGQHGHDGKGRQRFGSQPSDVLLQWTVEKEAERHGNSRGHAPAAHHQEDADRSGHGQRDRPERAAGHEASPPDPIHCSQHRRIPGGAASRGDARSLD